MDGVRSSFWTMGINFRCLRSKGTRAEAAAGSAMGLQAVGTVKGPHRQGARLLAALRAC